jgi:hypothetical protein
MVSLGNEAYVGRLIVRDNITVEGGITSTHKIIGEGQDIHHFRHNGSVFYLKYNEHHQLDSVSTTSGSTTVEWTATAAHNVEAGDTIHIGTFNNTGSDVSGIPNSELRGTFTVDSVAAVAGVTQKLSVTVPTAATSTDVSTNVNALLRITRYKSLNMQGRDVTWAHSTTEPSALHLNPVEEFKS